MFQRPLPDFQENTPATKTSKTTATVGTDSDYRLKISVLAKKQSVMEKEIAGYKQKIGLLEKQLERAKKVSKRRLRKINTLTKRNSRSSKNNLQLYDILMEKIIITN